MLQYVHHAYHISIKIKTSLNKDQDLFILKTSSCAANLHNNNNKKWFS